MSLKLREFLQELVQRKVPELDDETINCMIDDWEAFISQEFGREEFDTLMHSQKFKERLESMLSSLCDEIFIPIREKNASLPEDLPPS